MVLAHIPFFHMRFVASGSQVVCRKNMYRRCHQSRIKKKRSEATWNRYGQGQTVCCGKRPGLFIWMPPVQTYAAIVMPSLNTHWRMATMQDVCVRERKKDSRMKKKPILVEWKLLYVTFWNVYHHHHHREYYYYCYYDGFVRVRLWILNGRHEKWIKSGFKWELSIC